MSQTPDNHVNTARGTLRGRTRAWFGRLEQAHQVALLIGVITGMLGCGGTVTAAAVTGGFGLFAGTHKPDSENSQNAVGSPSGASSNPATTLPTTGAPSPVPWIDVQDPTRPPPQPTTPGPASPTGLPPQTPFAFSIDRVVPNCSPMQGTGDPPASGKAVLFVQFKDEPKYYYEQPLEFQHGAHTWSIDRVVVGGPGDAGKDFHLHAVVVTKTYAAKLAEHDGTPYYERTRPGRLLGMTLVTRNDQPGNCSQ